MSGVQLGMLVDASHQTNRQKIVDEIVENQFIEKTINTNIKEDARKLRTQLRWTM